jgi:hypothetical protein
LENSELPIKINACRALSKIFNKIPNEIKENIYLGIFILIEKDLYETLIKILKLTNEETTFIVLESLTIVVDYNINVLVESKSNFILILIQLLFKYFSDPILPVFIFYIIKKKKR